MNANISCVEIGCVPELVDALLPSHTPSLPSLCVRTESKGKGKVTAEEELRASKGKGKMVEPADVDDDEEDEEDFDEDVGAFKLIQL